MATQTQSSIGFPTMKIKFLKAKSKLARRVATLLFSVSICMCFFLTYVGLYIFDTHPFVGASIIACVFMLSILSVHTDYEVMVTKEEDDGY